MRCQSLFKCYRMTAQAAGGCFLGRGNAPLFEGISNAANVAALSSWHRLNSVPWVPVAIITFIAFLWCAPWSAL